jgi:predicted nucleic acid-binding protein
MPLPKALLDTDTLSAVHGLAVVTNNEDHFRRISGLIVENWFRP